MSSWEVLLWSQTAWVVSFPDLESAAVFVFVFISVFVFIVNGKDDGKSCCGWSQGGGGVISCTADCLKISFRSLFDHNCWQHIVKRFNSSATVVKRRQFTLRLLSLQLIPKSNNCAWLGYWLMLLVLAATFVEETFWKVLQESVWREIDNLGPV